MGAALEREIIRRYFEDAAGDPRLLGDLVHDDVVLNGGQPGSWAGCLPVPYTPPDTLRLIAYTNSSLDILHNLVSAVIAAFPDWRSSVQDVLVEGQQVAVRVSGSGTHTGQGFPGIPERARVTSTGLAWLRLSHGKIAEIWTIWERGEPSVPE